MSDIYAHSVHLFCTICKIKAVTDSVDEWLIKGYLIWCYEFILTLGLRCIVMPFSSHLIIKEFL